MRFWNRTGVSNIKLSHESNWLIAVLGVGLLVRLWGIWHGYPYSYYPDEMHFINRSVSLGNGDLNPHWFHKPAFLMYFLFFEYGIFYLIGNLFGYFNGVDSFAIYFFQSPWAFILIGRITVTLFGLGTIYVVYKIGEMCWNKKVGLYSEIFLVFSYGHVFGGQDVKADVPATFFTILSIFFLLRIVQNNFEVKDYVLTGVFAGLGTATKYYSILLLLCIFAASVYELYRKRDVIFIRKYIYSFSFFWAAYFMASPFNFLDPLGRRATFGPIIRIFNKIFPLKIPTYPRLEGRQNFLWLNYEDNYMVKSIWSYFDVLISTQGVGIILGILFICSAIYILHKHRLKALILLLFPVVFAAVSIIMNPSYAEPRHQLIIYPFFAVCAGVFIFELGNILNSQVKAGLLLAVLLIWPASSIIQNNIFISRVDTRTLAKEWIESNIPAGSRIVLDEYTPILQMSRDNLERLYDSAKREDPTGQFTRGLEEYYQYQMTAVKGVSYDIIEIRHPWWQEKETQEGVYYATSEFDKDMGNPIRPVGVMPLPYYVEEGYEYLVTSSIKYNAYSKGPNRTGFPSFARFYQDLNERATLIKEFNPETDNRPGPVIRVFRLE